MCRVVVVVGMKKRNTHTYRWINTVVAVAVVAVVVARLLWNEVVREEIDLNLTVTRTTQQVLRVIITTTRRPTTPIGALIWTLIVHHVKLIEIIELYLSGIEGVGRENIVIRPR